MAWKDTDLEHNITRDFGERFAKRYPDGKIEVARPETIPTEAHELFERRSRNFVSKESHVTGDFYGYLKVSHNDGSVSWLAWRKPFLNNINQWTYGIETGIYCQDMDPSGRPNGRGEISYWLTNRNQFFHDKPFLVYSETDKRYQGQGYDLRRVIMLNAVCELIFNLPLYSSNHFLRQENTGEKAHKKTWERLVREGVVRNFIDEGFDRYVFKQGGDVWQLLPGVLDKVRARRKNKQFP